MGGDIESEGVGGACAGLDGEVGGGGDHGGVVAAEFGLWEEEGEGREVLFGLFAEEGVGGDAAGEEDGRGLVFCYGCGEF